MSSRGIKAIIVIIAIVSLLVGSSLLIQNNNNQKKEDLNELLATNKIVEDMMQLYQLTLKQYKDQYISQSEFTDFLDNLINLNEEMLVDIQGDEEGEYVLLLRKYLDQNLKGYKNIKAAIDYNDDQYNKKAEMNFKEVQKYNKQIKKIEN